MQVMLKNERETEAFGRRLARVAQKGDVFLLVGGLGAGKTSLVRAFAAAFGCAYQVSSPTFTIMNRYQAGDLTINHFDLYRVKSPQELLDIGFEDFLDDGVAFIEWPDPARELLDGVDFTTVELTFAGKGRAATVTGKYEDVLS